MRKVLVEKYKKYDYVDSLGHYVWIDKYGDVIKVRDKFGNSQLFLGFKGAELMEPGIVWAPYIPLFENPVSEQRNIVQSIIGAANMINRYANKIAASNYIACSEDVANFIEMYGRDNIADYLPVTVSSADVLKEYDRSK